MGKCWDCNGSHVEGSIFLDVYIFDCVGIFLSAYYYEVSI